MWTYNYPNELYHYGVLGMKWGHRKQIRQARRDAKEYARAKMFYGEGAGTRRKLINNTVNERSKNSTYKKAFDEALSKQNMATHATKAKHERARKDIKNSVSKTGRGVVNMVTGHPERVGASLAVAAGAYTIARKTGADKVVAKAAKQSVAKVVNKSKNVFRGRYTVDDLLNKRGFNF